MSEDSRKLSLIIGVSSGVVLLCTFLQLHFGSYSLTAWETVYSLFDRRVIGSAFTLWRTITGSVERSLDASTVVIWQVRLPRVVASLTIGISLAVSGTILQAITRNELAGPYILGISAGAGFCSLLFMGLFSFSVLLLAPVSVLGCVFAFFLVYFIAWQKGTSPTRLILAGVIVNTIFASLQTGLFMFMPNLEFVRSSVEWLSGSLTGIGWENLIYTVPWLLLVALIPFYFHRSLDLFLLDEQTSSALGMDVEKMRFVLSLVAILGASISVAIAGLVGFVGLIVPHILRNTVGVEHYRILVGSLFLGPALMMFSDTLARLLFSPMQLPVGIVTGLIGGPYFLVLMKWKEDISDI